MNLLALLNNILRRRPRPMTEQEIAALAADADRFEEMFGVEDSRIIYDENER